MEVVSLDFLKSDVLADLDVKAFWAVHSGASHPALDPIALVFSGPWLWIALPVVLLLVGLFRRRPEIVRTTLLGLIAVGVTDLACGRMKSLDFFSRARPCIQFRAKVVLPTNDCGRPLSFPSNHAANAMAVTSVFFFSGLPGVALWILPFALLMGLSRVYLGVHFPGDVVGGFVVGGLLGWAAARAAAAPFWRRLRPA